MTGRYPISLGIQHNVFQPRTPECLSTNQHLLPDVVKSNGYATHMVGKWHLGYNKWKCLPCRRGFDSWLGFTQGYIEYVSHIVDDYPDLLQCSEDGDTGLQFKTLGELKGKYSMDIYEERAKNIIEDHDDEVPLFLYLALQAPHYPYYAPIRYMDEDCGGDRCVMQGMVRAIEGTMEGVINKMKTKGMWKDTILIFHSDNGAENSTFQSNYPLRGYKQHLWEGGVRTAAFVYSPNQQIMPNRGHSNSLIHVSDWFKTIITMSGGWDNWKAEGKIFPDDLDSIDQTRHILYGEEGARTNIMLHIDPVDRVAAYIKYDYKLLIGEISNHVSCSTSQVYPLDIDCLDMSQIQLYNIRDDPSERTDVWGDYPDIVNEMTGDLLSYLSHQKPLQCQFKSDPDGFPSSVVPFYLPWDFS